MQFLFLIINICLLSLPVIFSFGGRMHFYRQFPHILFSVLITGALFAIWDKWFIAMGIYEFNSVYLSDFYLIGIPVEQILAYFTLSYTCIFIYEALISYIGRSDTFEELYRWFTLLFFGIACSLLYWYLDKLYTAVSCLILSLILGTHLTVIRRRYLSWFYFAFAACLVPLFLFNGVICLNHIIEYNPEQITGFMLFKIPIENFIYDLTLLLLSVGLYEWFKRLSLRRRLHPRKLPS